MKRFVSFLLAAFLIFLATCSISAKENESFVSASFFDKYTPDGSAIYLKIKPGFDFLEQGSETLNWELALTGAVLSKEVYEVTYISDRKYGSDVQEALLDIGYQNATYYYVEDHNGNKPVHCFGYKKEGDKNIFAIVVRGTHSTADTIVTDIEDGGFRYFEDATLFVRDNFVDYATQITGKSIEDLKRENNYFFLTGHSLGGAIANRLSITDTIDELAGKGRLSDAEYKNRIYTYTYEAPHTCEAYFWMRVKEVSNAFNFTNLDDPVTHLTPGLLATRYGTDIEYLTHQLNDDVFQTLFPNANGTHVTEAPITDNYGDIWGYHDMGLPLTYIVQRGIKEKVWNSVEDVLISTQEMQSTSQEFTLPLKARDLSWIVEPTYDYVDVEPVWACDFSDVYGGVDIDWTDGQDSLVNGRFEEMSYPSYSCLNEYYSITNGNEYGLFYMPSRVDSGFLEGKVDPPYVYSSEGILSNTFGVGKGVWNVLALIGRGGGMGSLIWDVDSEQVYFDWSFDGPGNDVLLANLNTSLHKPYPVQQGEMYEDGSGLHAKVVNDLFAFSNPNGDLITEFAYDKTGTFSEGLCAVCINGKWGYIDEYGEEIVKPQFDAVWETGNKLDDSMIAYPCTSDTIVVSQDGKLGVLYYDGTLLIDFGQFEDLAPAWNNELWAKQDGKWGLIDLAAAKRSAGFLG